MVFTHNLLRFEPFGLRRHLKAASIDPDPTMDNINTKLSRIDLND